MSRSPHRTAPVQRGVALIAACALAGGRAAQADDTVDVGVIKKSDIAVVQKMLYPKSKRSELGYHLGWMPFDAFTTTPKAEFTFAKFSTEDIGYEVALGGGYSIKSAAYRELEGPAYGVAPDAYRYLGSVIADAQWSPVYAKLNWRGDKVYHHDMYGLGGLGLTVEQAIIPDHSFAFAPTLAVGIGTRIFLENGAAIRVQLRDDLMVEFRKKTEDTQPYFFKQNVGVSVGYTKFGKRK